ncbi:MAG: hypothetical protein ACRBBP_01210 [Bdellovibrionales bacterium]
MAKPRIVIFFMMLSFALRVFAYEDGGGFYRDEVYPVGESSTCGSLCISSPNYYEGYLYQQERNSRLFAPEVMMVKTRREEDMNALNYKKFGPADLFRGLGWGPNTEVSRMVMKRRIRISRALRDMGFQVEENNKSLSSAFWREIRKPFLYGIRDRLTAPYKKKKLTLGEKTKVWFLEQTVDAGASSLDLDSFGGSDGQSFNTNFNIKNFILKFYPRVDPVKGRYGVRFKARKHISKHRPLHFGLSANYCNSSTGFGNKVCRYQHELSTSFSFINPTKRWACSAYLSYQTDSLDPDAYVVDGESYEHKPWITGVSVTYAFY